ncbi:MAG: chromate transporter [Sporomusaceae bacterium]|nr:chromate transporter [Sporomusaceae bacterium]
MEHPAKPASPTLLQLFCVWVQIGFTSFGGGAVTQYLIQEHFIYKHHWVTEEEYAVIVAMCQITPGMNIIAYTILIGKKLGGRFGIALSLLGLILPSAAITVLLSAVYLGMSEYPRVQAMLRTVFAAIFGIALATNWRNVKPILRKNYRTSQSRLILSGMILSGSAIAYYVWQPPVFVLYITGALAASLVYSHVGTKGAEK